MRTLENTNPITSTRHFSNTTSRWSFVTLFAYTLTCFSIFFLLEAYRIPRHQQAYFHLCDVMPNFRVNEVGSSRSINAALHSNCVLSQAYYVNSSRFTKKFFNFWEFVRWRILVNFWIIWRNSAYWTTKRTQLYYFFSEIFDENEGKWKQIKLRSDLKTRQTFLFQQKRIKCLIQVPVPIGTLSVIIQYSRRISMSYKCRRNIHNQTYTLDE